MKFTYMLPSYENPKLEYPVSFYINLIQPEKINSSLCGYAFKYPEFVNQDIKEAEIYKIYGSIPKDPNKAPCLKIHYIDRKIDMMNFVWPGYRTDDIMFLIFLETYGTNVNTADRYYQYLYLEHDVIVKCLLKFRSKIRFHKYSDVTHKDESYEINKTSMYDIMNGNRIYFQSVKGNPALNFTLYANDLVDMLKDGIIFICKK